VEALEGMLSKSDAAGIKSWFADYLRWMTTHPYGIEERSAKNNHGTCWVMQVAAFARLTANRELTTYCRDRFRTVLAPNQIVADGSFPLEMSRSKPYGYSLFYLDAMSTICQILSTPEENLWTFEMPDGRGIRKAVAFLALYIRDKSKWPMRQCSLLFAGLAPTCALVAGRLILR
jgi:hypothetical protein